MFRGAAQREGGKLRGKQGEAVRIDTPESRVLIQPKSTQLNALHTLFMTDKMIVLADLGRVKAYRVNYEMLSTKPQLEMVYDCEFPEAHGKMSDKVSDSAGRYSAGGQSGGTFAENHSLRSETEKRLLSLVAEKITELVRHEKHWFLAAAQEINPRLLELLDPEVKHTLNKNVAADLVKVPKHEILDHFLAVAG
jgi:protein required for attachment to host cells